MIGDGSKDKIIDVLSLKSTPNGGTAVTDDLKYTSKPLLPGSAQGSQLMVVSPVKYSRQNSIHVSPTVLFDGLIASEISSSWGKNEWTEWLAKKVV